MEGTGVPCYSVAANMQLIKPRFTLVNMRSDYKVLFVRGGVMTPTVAAESDSVLNLIPNAPTQGHLALHADLR